MAEGAEAAQEAFLHAVAAVDPTKRVKAHVRTGALDDWLGDRERPITLHVLAIGKAAARMTWGLVEANVPFKGLGVHPGGVPVPNWEGFRWIKAEHPVPGVASFQAGQAVWDWLDAVPEGEPVLVLLSGGASSLIERPREDISQEAVVEAWTEQIRAGLPIEQLNERRATLSSLKAGGLAAHVGKRPLRVWLISDVPADAPHVVGSGPFWDGKILHTVLAQNEDAVMAAGASLQAQGYAVYRHGTPICGNVGDEVTSFTKIFAAIEGDKVALVAGGEPTVEIPAGAPPGGRCQHAALLAAQSLSQTGSPGTFFAGATDGRDGVEVAGAWSDGSHWSPEAEAAVAGFESHTYLAKPDRLMHLGATGTNVADVWILLREP